MKEDDDQFGFQNSLNGNRENWADGRKYEPDCPYGKSCLNKYQGKNFERSTIWQRLKNRFVSSQKK